MAELDPEMRAILDDLADRRFPPAYALSPRGARAALNDLLAGGPEPEPVGAVHEPTVDSPAGDLPLRICEPDAPEPYPVVVYYHGGGFVRGSLDTHRGVLRFLTRAVGCLTVGVDYHRAPEHPFPAAADDAYAGLQWAAEHAGVYGGDPDRLAVAGDSAGGNLAAVTALRARDRGGPPLDHQVLLYPMVDRRFDTDSHEAHADNRMLPTRTLKWYWEQYLRRPLDAEYPYACPIRARDLSGVAPATVLTAGHDPLHDEGVAYADRLAAAGVPVEHADFGGAIHGFVSFGETDLGREGREAVADRLRAALAYPRSRRAAFFSSNSA